MDIHIAKIEDLPGVSKQVLELFGSSKVFAFKAEMGMGKTTFITTLLKAMGIEQPSGSPTYSLVNVYDSPKYGKIYHFDLYRLENEEEILDIGLEEMIYSDAYCFIEWPEKIAHLLPKETIWLYISRNEDDSRTLTIENL